MTDYYGEAKCESKLRNGNDCRNNAYYLCLGSNVCGVHSRNKTRTKLPKNPNADKIRQETYDRHMESVEKARCDKPEIIVSKMRMMKQPPFVSGFLNVYPNYKHGNRKDGLGLMKLSPKYLGPVNHCMPGIPPAKSLENYHQFAKVYSFEVDDNGDITPEAFKLRCTGYDSSVPQRHKFVTTELPMCSAFYDPDGKLRRYTYLQCRYFYCHYYEELVKETNEYKLLRDKIKAGYSINICGYDGCPIIKPIYDHYTDLSHPFGHELVLYTMLTVDDPEEYPWNIYCKLHPDIYKNMV